MEEIAIALDRREVTGKAVKHLRKKGIIPAIIHDHGKESIAVEGPYLLLAKAYKKAGKNHPVSLNADGKKYMALIKQVTYDPKKHVMSHIVFNAIKANQVVTAEIPVHIKFEEGNDSTPAERASLVVLHQLEVVEVEALPKDLPEALYFAAEKLTGVGDQATVADLIVPAHVTVKTDATQTLATVFEPSALQAANDAVGGDDDDEEAETEKSEDTAAAASETAPAPEKK